MSNDAHRRIRRGGWVWVCAGFGLLAGAGSCLADYQGSQHIMAYDQPPISYREAKPEDPIARLQARLDAGQIELKHDEEYGYLLSVLKALDIPVSSQMLVFSKTSLHRSLISPDHPRAVYFNDEVYVGWVRWAPLLEISAADPKKGGMFYVLAQNPDPQPRFVRNDSCLECHVSGKTLGVPGHLIRSFEVDEAGVPDETTGGTIISHNTPLEDRWGGWYVTGSHGKHGHQGNLFGQARRKLRAEDASFGGNLTDLNGLIDTNQFVSPHSDIVALMVFEHQVHMHNFITRLNYEATIHLAQYGHVGYLSKPVDSFVRYMLFLDEPPILSRIRGTSGYAEEFQQLGPADPQGRSLRQLELYTRLFQYPCSYLIYSEAFNQLPPPLLERIYRRLYETLRGDSQESLRWNAELRGDVIEILRQTKPGLPSYWMAER